MYIKKENCRVDMMENVRGGKGVLPMVRVQEEGSVPHLKTLSIVTVDPGNSLGKHEHIGETEIYYILSGEATIDDNGTIVKANPGDAVVTGNGAYHAVENTSGAPVTFVAIIVTE